MPNSIKDETYDLIYKISQGDYDLLGEVTELFDKFVKKRPKLNGDHISEKIELKIRLKDILDRQAKDLSS